MVNSEGAVFQGRPLIIFLSTGLKPTLPLFLAIRSKEASFICHFKLARGAGIFLTDEIH